MQTNKPITRQRVLLMGESSTPLEIVSVKYNSVLEEGTRNRVTICWDVKGTVKTQTITYNGETVRINRLDRSYTIENVVDDMTATLCINNKNEDINIKFVEPSYVGVFEGNINTIDAGTILNGEKIILGSREFEKAFTCDFNRFFFAYPKQLEPVKEAYDANGFDAIDCFDSKEIEVNKKPYYVYVSNLDAKFDDLKFRFL